MGELLGKPRKVESRPQLRPDGTPSTNAATANSQRERTRRTCAGILPPMTSIASQIDLMVKVRESGMIKPLNEAGKKKKKNIFGHSHVNHGQMQPWTGVAKWEWGKQTNGRDTDPGWGMCFFISKHVDHIYYILISHIACQGTNTQRVSLKKCKNTCQSCLFGLWRRMLGTRKSTAFQQFSSSAIQRECPRNSSCSRPRACVTSWPWVKSAWAWFLEEISWKKLQTYPRPSRFFWVDKVLAVPSLSGPIVAFGYLRGDVFSVESLQYIRQVVCLHITLLRNAISCNFQVSFHECH